MRYTLLNHRVDVENPTKQSIPFFLKKFVSETEENDSSITVKIKGLERFIEEKRETGVYLSLLGFGSGNLHSSTMDTLASAGNGNYYYIDSILEARKVFIETLGGTLLTLAKDAKARVEFNSEIVEKYRLYA